MGFVVYNSFMKFKNLDTPVFFPDATRAVLRTLDSVDITNTNTKGILVNTYHLYTDLGADVIKKHGGIKKFMNWDGAVISDSGGFQVMSVAKTSGGKITDEGVIFRPSKNKKSLFTPEDSIKFQFILDSDMVVVLDDFTPPGMSEKVARNTVERTILWAKQCKEIFNQECERKKLDETTRPYLLGVVQGGEYEALRAECAQRLVDIGFDGLGYGGWPIDADGKFDYKSAQIIAENAPKNYFLYGLGIGKPDEVVTLSKMGYHIFDCVLPTRDARHKRLYVFDKSSPKGFSYYVPDRERYYKDTNPIDKNCDCLLCTHYTRSYLAHLFRIGDATALRLATIHNLRFYSMLMEGLQKES